MSKEEDAERFEQAIRTIMSLSPEQSAAIRAEAFDRPLKPRQMTGKRKKKTRTTKEA